MGTLAALALATPIWGFALTPPTVGAPAIVPEQVAQMRTTTDEGNAIVRLADPRAMPAPAVTPAMDWTRYLSLVTMAGFAATLTLGAIQFADEYGFNARYTQTACATGDAVLDYCGESTPWAHLTAALGTATLGIATLFASTQVDYDHAERVDRDWRIYEVTRWIGLVTVGIQAIFGFFVANAVRFGWADEQRDFATLQTLAGVHLGWGVLTAGMEAFSTALLF